MTMDAQDFQGLRNKLNALSYTQPLDPGSAPLASALLDDLIQLTESHRISKLECDRRLQEIANFNSQV